MRTFVLQRDVDDTGISGTGVVAEGVEFTDASVVLRWFGEHKSTVLWASLADVLAIHGHDGKTRVVFAETDSQADSDSMLEASVQCPSCGSSIRAHMKAGS